MPVGLHSAGEPMGVLLLGVRCTVARGFWRGGLAGLVSDRASRVPASGRASDLPDVVLPGECLCWCLSCFSRSFLR